MLLTIKPLRVSVGAYMVLEETVQLSHPGAPNLKGLSQPYLSKCLCNLVQCLYQWYQGFCTLPKLLSTSVTCCINVDKKNPMPFIFYFLPISGKKKRIFSFVLKREHFSLVKETRRLWSPFTHIVQAMNSFSLSTVTCIIYAWEIWGLMIRKFIRKMSMTLVISYAPINCSVCFMSGTSYEIEDFPQHLSLSKYFSLKENKSIYVLSRVRLNFFCYIARIN